MKRILYRSMAFMLMLVMVMTMFSACGSTDSPAPVSVAPETVAAPTTITIQADGQEITVENANGKTLRQLLEQANITLGEEDMLFLDPDQMLPDQLTLQVRRKCSIQVIVDMENPEEDANYTAVLIGGTVADALDVLGLELSDNQLVNFELDKPLENNLAIVITQAPEEETQPEETEPEETEPEETEPSYSDSNTGSNNTPAPTTPAPTTPAPTTPAPTTPAPTEPKPTEPAPTEPAPTEPERYVVSVEEYLDCDGSGHGVKVITYSDGTQEEVYF